MLFVFAIILGLIINYFTGGMEFNTALCFFVGLFLIMPILLKINFKDIKNIFSHKKILFIDIFLNFVLIPLIAFIVGYFVFGLDNYGFIVALMLLAIIPGGGLLMSWLHHTKANMHIGFVLFAINLFIFSIFYIGFNFGVEKLVHYQKHIKEKQSQTTIIDKLKFNPINTNVLQSNYLGNIVKQQQKQQAGCAIEQVSEKIGISAPSCFEENSTMIYGFFGFIALILIPFIVSRILLFFFKNNKLIFKYAPILSKVSAFILITYIFSLNYVRGLLKVDSELIIKISLSVVIFYILIFIIIKLLLKYAKFPWDLEKAIFWNAYTRFITLSLILSFLYAIAWKQPEIILIPIVAYFVQIGTAPLLAKQNNK